MDHHPAQGGLNRRAAPGRARTARGACALALALALGGPQAAAQPQRSADPQAVIEAVRSYFDQELPIGWRVREVQVVPLGRGANVFLEAPFWALGDLNAVARDVCPGTEAFLWRSVLFVTLSVSRNDRAGPGIARCTALGGRQ